MVWVLERGAERGLNRGRQGGMALKKGFFICNNGGRRNGNALYRFP
jgi:hypothetical protein